MKTLVFWGEGAAERARAKSAEGATILLWKDEGASLLKAAGVVFESVGSLLDLEARDRIDETAMAWTKAWGRRPLLDGRSFRDLLSWKTTSLWWFAELYLHHSTASPRYVRLIETFGCLLERLAPDEVEAVGLETEEALLLGRVCTVRQVLFRGPRAGRKRGQRARVLGVSLASRWNVAKAAATALKASLTGPPPSPPASGKPLVLFLSHAAFWRERKDPETDQTRSYEHYFDRLLPEVAADPSLHPFVVAVGPRAAFRRRGPAERLREWLRLHPAAGPFVHVNRYSGWRVFRETARAALMVRRMWRRLREAPAMAAAFSHAGVPFVDLAGPDLAGTLLLQLPWAVRCYEEMSEVLAWGAPAAVCLYAESSGWGRAALAASRAAGVPTLALQHGILYPKYYSYRHGPDEADCPRPDKTAVFGEAARRFLIQRGHYPPESLATTGSPKFDDLLLAARKWNRAEIRRRVAVEGSEKLLVVASRFQAIRETHHSIGSAFPALVRAVEALPGLKCLVKPHPAEPPDAYEECIREAGARRVQVLPSGADLLELLHAADALVTVESLAAVEALVLGRPVLVLNMPTHLRDLVEAGVALGVAAGEDPAPALKALLEDAATAEGLRRGRERYLSELAMGVDGRATQRILGLVREMTGRASRSGMVALAP